MQQWKGGAVAVPAPALIGHSESLFVVRPVRNMGQFLPIPACPAAPLDSQSTLLMPGDGPTHGLSRHEAMDECGGRCSCPTRNTSHRKSLCGTASEENGPGRDNPRMPRRPAW